MVELLKILVGAQRARMDERGASAVEYGLLVAAIAAVIVTVVFALGDNIRDMFQDACDGVNGAEAGCTAD